jgi:hypothetical protein
MFAFALTCLHGWQCRFEQVSPVRMDRYGKSQGNLFLTP